VAWDRPTFAPGQQGFAANLNDVTDQVEILRNGFVAENDDLAETIEALPVSEGRRSGIITLAPGTVYEVSETIVLDDAGGLVIQGQGGTPGFPRIVWKGAAGTGPLFRINSGYGVQFRNVLIGYDHAAFNGDLISCDHSAEAIDVQSLLIEGCWIGGLDGATSAASLIKLNKTITSIIRNNNLQYAVRAIKKGADYVTTLTIEDNAFAGFTSAPIYNPDNTWRIEKCTFEPLADGSAGAIDHDMTYWITGFLYEGNYHADASLGGTWVRGRFSGGGIGLGNFVVVPTNGTGYYLERTYGLTFTGLDVQPNEGATGTTGIEFNNEGGDKISESVTILGGQNTCATTIKNVGFCFDLEQRGVYPIATNPPRGVNEGYVGVASATTVTLPSNDQGGLFLVSGTTTITGIIASWNGRLITLVFASTAQVTDGNNLKIAGNFTGAADRTLTLRCDGSNWFEVARSTNA
jgi:hypothetical protein